MKKDSKGLKGFIQNNSVGLISFVIVALWMFIFMYVFKVAPFGYRSFAGSDCLYQMYPLLSVLQNKLQNGDSLLYYWNSGFGGEFLSSYFYYLSSPTNLLLFFFTKNDIDPFISFTVMFKFAFSAGSFGYYLSRRKGEIDNKAIYVALACGYALSNYMCCYYYDIMWLDSLMVFPLIILGLNKLINDNNPILYIITLAYSFYCNYYISYIICVFLILWFLFNYRYDINDFIKKGFRFAFCSILAAGMSAIALLTSYIGLTKTVSSKKDIIQHEWYGNIFEIIRNQFILTKIYMTTYKDNVANIYCGTIVIILLFSFLFLKEIKISERIKRVFLIILLYISMNESWLNYMWHGFHKQNSVPNRFAFLFIFLMLLTAADVIDLKSKDNIKSYVSGMVCAIILPLVSYFFIDFDSILSSHQVIAISMVLILIYGVFLIVSNYGKPVVRSVISVVFTIMLISELIFNSMMVIKYDLLNNLSTRLVFDSTENAVNSIKDDSLYRSEVIDGMVENQNAYHGINGINVFNSTINCESSILMQYLGIHTGINRINYDQPIPCFSDIFGIKYLYTYGENDYFNDSNYENVYDDGTVRVYKNPSALSIGFGSKKSIEDNIFVDFYDVSQNINMFCSCLADCNDVIRQVVPEYSISNSNCEVALGDTPYLSFMYDNVQPDKEIDISFKVPEEGLYYVDIRESNENDISIRVNDNTVRESIFIVNGICKVGYVKPEDNISVNISDNKGHAYQQNSLASEVKVFVFRIDTNEMEALSKKLANNQLKIDRFTSDSLSGKINLEDNQILFTTIPYDKGWHVYEDGKEVETCKLANAFLGVDLGAGEHNLVFKFVPEGFYLGLTISVISCIIFIIICIKHGNKKKNNSIKEDEEVDDKIEDESDASD